LQNFLKEGAASLTEDHMKHYFLGREKRYLVELERFVSDTCRRKKIKAPPQFLKAVEIGQSILQDKKKAQDLILKREGSIEKLVELIKENEFEEFKKYLENQ